MENITFEIIKCIGTVRDDGDWKLELNLVSWNNQKPKYDLRSWNADHSKCGKGVTMSEDELMTLKSLISKRVK